MAPNAGNDFGSVFLTGIRESNVARVGANCTPRPWIAFDTEGDTLNIPEIPPLRMHPKVRGNYGLSSLRDQDELRRLKLLVPP